MAAGSLDNCCDLHSFIRGQSLTVPVSEATQRLEWRYLFSGLGFACTFHRVAGFMGCSWPC
ncbi:hypothetical protein EMIT0P218_50139 [Pseudomonas sp. IT-P218]